MLCSPLGPSSWKPWPSLGLHRARPADQRFNLPHPSFPTQAPKTQNENWWHHSLDNDYRRDGDYSPDTDNPKPADRRLQRAAQEAAVNNAMRPFGKARRHKLWALNPWANRIWRDHSLVPGRKKSERWQTVVSFWPALLFNDADMRALRPRSNHHGLSQDPPDRK